MKRRDFIGLIGGGTVAFAARAQQAKGAVRIAFLFFGNASNAYDQSLVNAFREGLHQVGLIEDRDIVLDVVWISADADQAIIEAIKRGAELLVPTGSTTSVAARRQTSTIPIVFISVGNPIAMGLVDSLAHPGHNATGFSDILGDLSAKLVDIARELGKHDTIDYLWHTAWPDGQNRYQATEQAARAAGVTLRSKGFVEIAEAANAIAAMKRNGATTLIIQPSPYTYQHRDQISELATRQGLATIFAFPVAAREGALIGYGPDYLHMYRRASLYVDRIIKGTKPADLPVELPAKVELVVNLKTAKTLGIEVPFSLLVRADDLVE